MRGVVGQVDEKRPVLFALDEFDRLEIHAIDEEFVFETRIGDTLMLGSQVWRVIDIDDNRLIVTEAPGAIPRMPFWRGDFPWRRVPGYIIVQLVGATRHYRRPNYEAHADRLPLSLQDHGDPVARGDRGLNLVGDRLDPVNVGQA